MWSMPHAFVCVCDSSLYHIFVFVRVMLGPNVCATPNNSCEWCGHVVRMCGFGNSTTEQWVYNRMFVSIYLFLCVCFFVFVHFVCR